MGQAGTTAAPIHRVAFADTSAGRDVGALFAPPRGGAAAVAADASGGVCVEPGGGHLTLAPPA
jgi:hypothetical protein